MSALRCRGLRHDLYYCILAPLKQIAAAATITATAASLLLLLQLPTSFPSLPGQRASARGLHLRGADCYNFIGNECASPRNLFMVICFLAESRDNGVRYTLRSLLEVFGFGTLWGRGPARRGGCCVATRRTVGCGYHPPRRTVAEQHAPPTRCYTPCRRCSKQLPPASWNRTAPLP